MKLGEKTEDDGKSRIRRGDPWSPASRRWRLVTHISQKSILWESIFDSFSLEGEAFGGNLDMGAIDGNRLDTGQRLLPPAGEKLSSIGSSEPMDD
jgi:hypothetical protein